MTPFHTRGVHFVLYCNYTSYLNLVARYRDRLFVLVRNFAPMYPHPMAVTDKQKEENRLARTEREEQNIDGRINNYNNPVDSIKSFCFTRDFDKLIFINMGCVAFVEIVYDRDGV